MKLISRAFPPSRSHWPAPPSLGLSRQEISNQKGNDMASISALQAGSKSLPHCRRMFGQRAGKELRSKMMTGILRPCTAFRHWPAAWLIMAAQITTVCLPRVTGRLVLMARYVFFALPITRL